MNDLEQRISADLKRVALNAPPFRGLDRAQVRVSAPRPWLLPALAAAVVAIIAAGGYASNEYLDSSPAISHGNGITEPGTPEAPSAGVGDGGVGDSVLEQVHSYENLPGYGKVLTSSNGRTINVFWSGTPPEGLRQLAESRPDGISIFIFEATYSAAELDAAGSRLFSSGSHEGGIPMSTVRPNPDLSGLIVQISPKYLTGDIESLTTQLQEIAEVPVIIDRGEPPVDLAR